MSCFSTDSETKSKNNAYNSLKFDIFDIDKSIFLRISKLCTLASGEIMNLRTKESVEKLNQIRQEKIYRELMTGETTVNLKMLSRMTWFSTWVHSIRQHMECLEYYCVWTVKLS